MATSQERRKRATRPYYRVLSEALRKNAENAERAHITACFPRMGTSQESRKRGTRPYYRVLGRTAPIPGIHIESKMRQSDLITVGL